MQHGWGDSCGEGTSPQNKYANLVDCTLRVQRCVLRNTFSTELDGPPDRIKSMMLLQAALHQIHCGTQRSPDAMADLQAIGNLHSTLDLGVDATTVIYVISASCICDPPGSGLTIHPMSVRDCRILGLCQRTGQPREVLIGSYYAASLMIVIVNTTPRNTLRNIRCVNGPA